MTRLPSAVLKETFGFDSFRGEQEAIIAHLIQGNDALVLMPTGGGKSLCYQIPALCADGLTIVVSPLIALMRNQVEALRQLGVRAAALNSALPFFEAQEIEEHMQQNAIDLVYVSPERLLKDAFLNLLSKCSISLFAIDEAHCVSQWGHDFRPEYKKLTVLHERFPKVARLALTATADEPTRREIIDSLQLQQGRIFSAGFDRPNIRYSIGEKDSPHQQLQRFITTTYPKDSGIVYCLSRAKVEKTANFLVEAGFKALPYHAGLTHSVREQNQDRFLKEDGVIMVATVAFGMGIDKPDVRFVAHMDLPKSLESYYQETGRAGRDGLPSHAWMIYSMQDVVQVRQMIDNGEANDRRKHLERQKLEALLGYCETTRCRREVLLEYFNDRCTSCQNCDTCLNPVETFEGSVIAQKALSCVYRTGQRFGAGHVIDVLTGAKTARIQELGHDCLSTYGIGNDLSKKAWRSIFRQLVAWGLLLVDPDYGGLYFSAGSRTVLSGDNQIWFRRDPEKQGKQAKEKPARSSLETEEENALFDRLRTRRLELAKEQNVPPYVIFHDRSLIEMVKQKPQQLEDFAQISGVGAEKLKRYAPAFLPILENAA